MAACDLSMLKGILWPLSDCAPFGPHLCLALASRRSHRPALAQEFDEGEGGAEIIVTGSRIPTIRDQGPSPVTTIDADTIRANGYTSVPELLAAMTQNSGETQSPQSGSSADFTPGAQQVDLRGLGRQPHIGAINGRRIADFPLPYIGRSNFTDISNIPVSLIEKVEILSGAGSAIYRVGRDCRGRQLQDEGKAGRRNAGLSLWHDRTWRRSLASFYRNRWMVNGPVQHCGRD